MEIFSPQGGKCEPDAMSDPRDSSGYSSSDLISMGFIATPKLAALVEATKPVRDLDSGCLRRSRALQVVKDRCSPSTRRTTSRPGSPPSMKPGKVTAALCHGVAILAYTELSNWRVLAKGKTVTGFANVEEDFADNAVWSMNFLSRDKHVMPWRIEDRMREIGANYIHAGLWRGFAIRDGNLITGPTELLRR